MAEVTKFPAPLTTDRQPPRPIMRPCDAGLSLAIMQLEDQLGTVEAYNRLCNAAQAMREQIDAGNAKAQNPIYALALMPFPDLPKD